MQQYCHSVCERQQQAVHRDQALLQDARQAHSRAASSLTTTAVDTSRLETLKTQYLSSIASLHPQWLAQVNAQRESLRLSIKSQPTTTHSVLHTHSRVTTQTSPTDRNSFGFEPKTTVAVNPLHTPSPSAPLVSSTDVSVAYVPVSYSPALLSTTTRKAHTPSHSVPLVPSTVVSVVSVPASYSPALLSTTTRTAYTSPNSGGSVHIPSHVHSTHTPLLATPKLHPVSYTSVSAATTSHPQPLSSVLPQSLPGPLSPSGVSRSDPSSHDSTEYHGRQQPDPLLLASKPTLPSSHNTQEIPVSAVQQTRSKQPVHSHTIASTQPSTVAINTREIARDMRPLEFGPSRVSLKPVVTNREKPMVAAAATTHHSPANDSLPTPMTHDAVDRDLDPQPLDCLPSTSTKRPQNVLILSQENSDSLSETPLDLTDEEEGGGQAGIRTDCTRTVLSDHAKENGCFEDSLLQPQSIESPSLDSLPPKLQHVLDESRQRDPRAAVRPASMDSSEEADERERARIAGSEREEDATMTTEERNGNGESVDEGQVIQSKEEESSTFDESDSISLSIPLPPSPDKQPQTKPSARATSSNVHVGERTGPTDMTGSSTKSQVELRTSSIDTGVVNGQRNEETEESNSPDPQSQDGADAYTTFLQTVRHTSGTDALALLDSESDDIEGIIATGVRSDSEVENTSLSSAAIGGDGGGGVGGDGGGGGGREMDKSGEGEQQPHLTSASALASPLRRNVKGGEGRGGDEDEASLDDSDSSDPQSMQAPSYIPTAMEEQPGPQSSVLKKRLGFWGSDDSLDGSDLALSKSPTAEAAAEDDKGDFDFYF